MLPCHIVPPGPRADWICIFPSRYRTTRSVLFLAEDFECTQYWDNAFGSSRSYEMG